MRRHIERRVINLNRRGRYLFSEDRPDLIGTALLDRDVTAAFERQIERRYRRDDIEGDTVMFCEDRDAISAYLIGGITVGGYPVGADKYLIDLSLRHKAGGHVVAYQCRIDAFMQKFPCGQPRALKQRTRLIGVHFDRLFLPGRLEQHTESGTIIRGSEPAGIAVRQYCVALPDKARAVPRHLPAVLLILVNDRQHLPKHQMFQRTHRLRFIRPRNPFHPAERPEKVNRRWPGRRKILRGLLDLTQECFAVFSLRFVCRQQHTERTRYPDRRRAAYLEALNRLPQAPDVSTVGKLHLSRKQRLVYIANFIILPCNRFNGHVHSLSLYQQSYYLATVMVIIFSGPAADRSTIP